MIGDGMAHSPSIDDPSSVTAVGVAGDTSLMWTEFAGRLRAFVARRVPPGIEPEDVVQEVFLRVMRPAIAAGCGPDRVLAVSNRAQHPP
jgi:hypothetical protein